MRIFVGNLRIYSLADLGLLLIASNASSGKFVGSVLVWLGFLLFLEWRHRHDYRAHSPSWLWMVLVIIGLGFYPSAETLLFLLCSLIYSQKVRGKFGLVSPLFGGLNRFFLIAGITGYGLALPWVVLVLMSIRNFFGDIRDAGKDSKEGLETLPVLIGIRKNYPYVHLLAVLATSIIWWKFANLSIFILLTALIIEVFTYNITPRNLEQS